VEKAKSQEEIETVAKPVFLEKFLGSEICEQVSLLDVGAREQISITQKLPKKTVLRQSQIAKAIEDTTCEIKKIAEENGSDIKAAQECFYRLLHPIMVDESSGETKDEVKKKHILRAYFASKTILPQLMDSALFGEHNRINKSILWCRQEDHGGMTIFSSIFRNYETLKSFYSPEPDLFQVLFGYKINRCSKDVATTTTTAAAANPDIDGTRRMEQIFQRTKSILTTPDAIGNTPLILAIFSKDKSAVDAIFGAVKIMFPENLEERKKYLNTLISHGNRANLTALTSAMSDGFLQELTESLSKHFEDFKASELSIKDWLSSKKMPTAAEKEPIAVENPFASLAGDNSIQTAEDTTESKTKTTHPKPTEPEKNPLEIARGMIDEKRYDKAKEILESLGKKELKKLTRSEDKKALKGLERLRDYYIGVAFLGKYKLEVDKNVSASAGAAAIAPSRTTRRRKGDIKDVAVALTATTSDATFDSLDEKIKEEALYGYFMFSSNEKVAAKIAQHSVFKELSYRLSKHLHEQREKVEEARREQEKDAMFNYAGELLFGGGDKALGRAVLTDLAKKGYAPAQNNLGNCYERGDGVPKDQERAVDLYRLAADKGLPQAQFNLGNCYKNGIGISVDGKEAARWYKLAADQGSAPAQNNLGNCYDDGIGVAKDEVEAVRWYRLAADQGHAPAQNNLGVNYTNGTGGVAKDLAEAVRWYRLAAYQGHELAQFNLGICYGTGKGVAKDLAEAARWYKLAADQGHSLAQFNFGLCYERGDGVAKSLVDATRLYRLAADQGHALAQYNLGVHYLKGTGGVAKSLVEATRLYRLAADQGHALAQYNLGVCYDYGTGVAKDEKEAAKWYKLAADQGHELARFNIIRMNHTTIKYEEPKKSIRDIVRTLSFLACEDGEMFKGRIDDELKEPFIAQRGELIGFLNQSKITFTGVNSVGEKREFPIDSILIADLVKIVLSVEFLRKGRADQPITIEIDADGKYTTIGGCSKTKAHFSSKIESHQPQAHLNPPHLQQEALQAHRHLSQTILQLKKLATAEIA
jgi:TPR repeat protein